MNIWAYVVILAMLGGAVLWYKGTIDDAWKAKLDKANAEVQKTKDAAKLQTEKSNAKVEALHAKLANAVQAIQSAPGCASTPLPADAVAVYCDLRLLDAESCARLLPRPSTRPTTPTN